MVSFSSAPQRTCTGMAWLFGDGVARHHPEGVKGTHRAAGREAEKRPAKASWARESPMTAPSLASPFSFHQLLPVICRLKAEISSDTCCLHGPLLPSLPLQTWGPASSLLPNACSALGPQWPSPASVPGGPLLKTHLLRERTHVAVQCTTPPPFPCSFTRTRTYGHLRFISLLPRKCKHQESRARVST